jgi:hypothetical protein
MTDKFKTAVVIVHGMGSQKPRETVNGFVQTALEKSGSRIYYSRPDQITSSYEARRLLAIERKKAGATLQTQTEFFEYHWSYMMKGNQFRDLLPTSLRLLLRSPLRVPWQLLFPWLSLWLAIFVLGYEVVELLAHHKLKALSINGVIKSLFPNVGVAALVTLVVFALIGWVTSSFVDVVRYLDNSPRSYEVRRAIRGGMVDLLRKLHATDSYSRVIVVAHSLGGFIAYDGLTTFWDETDRGQDRNDLEFSKLADLEAAAQPLAHDPAQESTQRDVAKECADANQPRVPGSSADGDSTERRITPEPDYGPKDARIIAFRAAQLSLWKQLRENAINWRVTDFITLGTPMYLADILFTRNRGRFDNLRKRSELPQCPPRSDSETVEGTTPEQIMYGRRVDGDARRRLVTGSPFAVVRWSNFWFPPVCGIFGDPFGGSLADLFGNGIDNRKVTVDRPGRYIPIWAHTKYFKYPDRIGTDFVAPVIRNVLDLKYDDPRAAEG